MVHTVYIGIGSNLGDRGANCLKAIELIALLEDTRVIATSNWYENKALMLRPGESQPDYINGAVKIETRLGPDLLLLRLKEIENSMGRPERREKWSPRKIDLDILFYDDSKINQDGLTIPHPEMTKRPFVLKPLCDIDPEFKHPVDKRSFREILMGLENK